MHDRRQHQSIQGSWEQFLMTNLWWKIGLSRVPSTLRSVATIISRTLVTIARQGRRVILSSTNTMLPGALFVLGHRIVPARPVWWVAREAAARVRGPFRDCYPWAASEKWRHPSEGPPAQPARQPPSLADTRSSLLLLDARYRARALCNFLFSRCYISRIYLCF